MDMGPDRDRTLFEELEQAIKLPVRETGVFDHDKA
jgi:hypothetical protein